MLVIRRSCCSPVSSDEICLLKAGLMSNIWVFLGLLMIAERLAAPAGFQLMQVVQLTMSVC